jgi:hypothetical protein
LRILMLLALRRVSPAGCSDQRHTEDTQYLTQHTDSDHGVGKS